MAYDDYHIDTRDLDRVKAMYADMPTVWSKALRSTVGKVAKWLKTKAVKGLSKELKMQQKVLRVRLKAVKVKNTRTGPQAAIWFGLNPVGMQYLGPRKSAKGVSSKATGMRKGAFMVPGKTNGPVFKRGGKGRLPLEKQTATIKQQTEHFIERQEHAAEVQIYFMTVLERELQWRTNTK